MLLSVLLPVLLFFPDPTFLITDGGPSFKAELFAELARLRGFNHHIVTPYSQWANGLVERLNRVWRQRMAALLHDLGEDWNTWPEYVPTIQEALNKRLPVSSRGNKTPMELLMGVTLKSGLQYVAYLGVDATTATTADNGIVDRNLRDLHNHLQNLWGEAVQAQRTR